uniref:Uncharacterized protein n=1 Tax=Tanacetum cinerariifolium TaxID=118510 RepID=A0A699JMA4_TANCI|nr:hypothetical protein [Tanacetum cinerariifolium]
MSYYTNLYCCIIISTQKYRKTKRKAIEISQSSGPTTLVADETVHEERGDIVERVDTTAASSDIEQDSGGSPNRQDTILGDRPAQTMFERVLALENNKTARDLEITHLKKRVNRLEKKRQSRTPQLNRSINITTAEPVTTVSALITTDGVSVSTAEPSTPLTKTTTVIEDEDLTIAQTLMKIRTSETTTRPTVPPQQNLILKDKGKGKMVEPEKPLKNKDQIEFDEEVAKNLEAQLQAELEEEERLARQKEANIALIAEWDDVQAMMDADHKIAERLQAEEQGELSIKERSKIFVELMNQRKKHFARLRAEEKRIKPPTKAQKRNQMCTYLKNMAGSSKRAREELKSDKSKKQKLDEMVEAEEDNNQEEVDMKMYMKIVSDDDVAIDAIPLATKPSIIVDWKIIKEGKISSYHIIRADGSSKKYSSMIQMLQNIDREDLETLWKLVKAKIKRLLSAVEVTAASYEVTTADYGFYC